MKGNGYIIGIKKQQTLESEERAQVREVELARYDQEKTKLAQEKELAEQKMDLERERLK